MPTRRQRRRKETDMFRSTRFTWIPKSCHVALAVAALAAALLPMEAQARFKKPGSGLKSCLFEGGVMKSGDYLEEFDSQTCIIKTTSCENGRLCITELWARVCTPKNYAEPADRSCGFHPAPSPLVPGVGEPEVDVDGVAPPDDGLELDPLTPVTDPSISPTLFY
jgi:hypothetical protein